ncbi:MAG: CinA family protein [Candidatus Omnitrophota bacterium]
MQNITFQVHKCLLKNNKTIAVAESCTGGLISKLLTDLPGSSKYFILGITAYSNLAKQNLLKVPAKVIAKNGAVSAAVATTMAKNIRKIAKTNLGIGITGIAGPSGGTPGKPAGTVFIAVSSSRKTLCGKFFFLGNRDNIRSQAALKSLELLRRLL